MAKTDNKKNKSPSKAKVKNPLKKVKKDTKPTKRAGASKKVVPKKGAKATKGKENKKTAAKTKSFVAKTKKTPVKPKKTDTKKKATTKAKPKTVKKPVAKPTAVKKLQAKAKTPKKAEKKTTKKKVVATKVKKPKTADKKKKTKKDAKPKKEPTPKKKPTPKKTVKKVVSSKKTKISTKKSADKKQKTVKKATTPSAKKKLAVSKVKATKRPKKDSKAKPKSLKQKPKQKSKSQLKKVSKVARASKESKAKLSSSKLKTTKAKHSAAKSKAAQMKKKVTKGSKPVKGKDTTKVKKTQKQAVKSKTLTESQKQQIKKAKELKKLKAHAAAKKTSKGKENKAPVKKRKAVDKKPERGVKKTKLTAKETGKKKTQKQTLKISIQNKKPKEPNEKKTVKKLTVTAKKQKKPESPKKNLSKAMKPKQTTPKKKKGKSIDDIGNWSPSIPEVSTVSPVWGYTPPGNFGKKSTVVYQEAATKDKAKKNDKKSKSNPSKIKALSGTSFNIKTTGDEKAVWITGMAVFPNGQLIMCDIQNVKLKLYDATSLKLLNFVKTLKLPQDISISALNPTDAYFTLNMEKAIQKCSVQENTIVLGERFSVNGCCRGIVCTTNGIITSVENSAFIGYQIQVRDYDGTIMRTISNMNGKLFSHPICFDITSDGDRIVISDCALISATICLDINGKVVYRYTGVSRQRGITMDESNNIYLPDHSSPNKVILLSPEGSEVKELITKATKGVNNSTSNISKPYQICYCRHQGVPMLFLSIQEHDSMYVFKLNN